MHQIARKIPAADNRFRWLRLRLAYLLLLVIMGFFGYSFWQKTREIKQLTGQAAALQFQNQQTRANNARVRRAIAYYRTPQYVEETARADLGYTMPGEVSVQSQPITQRIPTIRRAPPPLPPTPKPTWQQWWAIFSH
jgi:cell division protein FtsB